MAKQRDASGTVFVGRGRQLDAVEAAIAEARDRVGSIVGLHGEPGIGKTHLARQLVHRARDAGVLTAWGQCWEWGGAPSFWPWAEVIRKLLGTAPKPSTPAPAEVSRLVEIVPELRAFVGDPPVEADASPTQARFMLFHAATTTLRWICGEATTLIVFDDLHAADVASLQLLRFAARELVDAPIVFLATVRNVATRGHRGSEIDAGLDELAAVWRHIDVPVLSVEDVGTIVGLATGSDPSAESVERLHRATGGNALFVDRMSRALALDEGEGALVHAPLDPPESLRAAVRTRLKPLDGPTRTLLVACAVLGRPASRFFVARLVELAPDVLDPALDTAIDSGLLAHGAGGSGYSIRHGVVREAVYGELDARERIRWHGRVADLLEELHGDAPGSHLAELAHHYSRASELDDRHRRKAAQFERRVGDQAMAQLAFEDAASHYARATEAMLESTPDRLDLSLRRGEAELAAGDTEAARATFDGASRHARAANDPEALVRAALGFAQTGDYAEKDPQKLSLLEESLAALAPDDLALRSRIRGRMAMELWADAAATERADQLSQLALENARDSGATDALGFAIQARLMATGGPSTVEERMTLGRELTALGEANDNPEWVLEGQRWLLNTALERGHMEAADASLRHYTRAAQRLRRRRYQYNVALRRCFSPASRGEFDTAIARIDHAREVGEQAGDQHAAAAWCFGRVYLAYAAGRAHTLGPVLEEVDDHARRLANLAGYRALVVIGEHYTGLAARPQSGRASFDDITLEDVGSNFSTLAFVAGLAHACVLLRERGRAALLLERYGEFRDRFANVGAYVPLGSFARYLGALAWLTGDLEGAFDLLGSAVTANERVGALPFVVWSRRELARLLAQRGTVADRSAAASLEREASELARRLGMDAADDSTMIPAPTSVDISAHPVQRAVPGPPPDEQPDARPLSARTGVLVREGDLWVVTFGGHTRRARNQRGLEYLARLLGSPGVDVHVLDLAGSPGAPEGDAGPALDATAKQAYRVRISELSQIIETARAHDDIAAGTRAEAELEFIARELSSATGLGGRDRPTSSASERARSAVTRALRRTLATLRELDVALGEHLDTSVKTGTYCTYRPDPGAPVEWTLDTGR